MNIVFLDVDGVLNSKNNLIKIYNETHKPYSGYSYPFDYKCLENLKELIIKTDSKIVITSSWRKSSEGLETLLNVLKEYDLEKYIIGYTPVLGLSRGTEIKIFLENFKYEDDINFVILDDDNDMEFLSKYLIHIDNAVGLTAENVRQALEMLNVQIERKVRKF